MNKIVVRNPNTTLPVGSWYPEEEEILICQKLYVVVLILYELRQGRETVRKLKNHPIHEFTSHLWDVAASLMMKVGQLEFLVREIQEVADDFKRSRNAWAKERTSTALRVMNEIIDGDYTIDKSIYTDPNRD
jgi:hypothetical protein